MAGNKKPRKAYRPKLSVMPPPALRMLPPNTRSIDRRETDYTLALAALTLGTAPDAGDMEAEWRTLSDCVNIVDTMAMPKDRGGLGLIDGAGPVVDAAIKALAEAGMRYRKTGRMGLTGEGIQALREVIAAYSSVSRQLSLWEMTAAHDLTAHRMAEILMGRTPTAPGVTVIAV